jgi:hypothetical protein
MPAVSFFLDDNGRYCRSIGRIVQQSTAVAKMSPRRVRHWDGHTGNHFSETGRSLCRKKQ